MKEQTFVLNYHTPPAHIYEFNLDDRSPNRKGKNMTNVENTQMAEALAKLDEKYTDEQLAEVLAISDTEQAPEPHQVEEVVITEPADR